jgi:hypothetical protein
MAAAWPVSRRTPAIGHATRVLDLLRAGRFGRVAAEFNAKMAAAMPVTAVLRVDGGPPAVRRAHVDRQSAGRDATDRQRHRREQCQFEKALLAIMLSFDAENRIAE